MTTPGSPSPDQQPGGQNPYGQQNQPQYGQPQYGQPQYGQPQYGQPQYGQLENGQPQYGQPQYGQPQYGQPEYAQQPPQSDPYGLPQPGQPQNQYGQNPYAPAAQPAGLYSPTEGDPGNLDLPWYGIGLGDAVKRVFQKYARFDGRASRGEFWWWTLGDILIAAVLSITLLIGGVGAILLFVYALAVIVPSIAVSVRRLHDGGYSGWLYLIGFVPFVGGIALIVLMAMPSKPEGAQYDKVTARPAGY